MKVTLEYDEVTGEIRDNGMFVFNIGVGFNFSSEAKKDQSSIKDLVMLKDAGYSPQDIMQMKREGLI